MLLIKILREGIKIIPTGGMADNGRLILTKVLTSNFSIKEELEAIFHQIRFPAYLSIDAHGFLSKTEPEGKDELIFCMGSPNSGIILPNGKSNMLVSTKSDTLEMKDFIQKLDDGLFLEKWFAQHDLLADYKGSGLQPRRLVNIVIFVDPFYLPVSELI